MSKKNKVIRQSKGGILLLSLVLMSFAFGIVQTQIAAAFEVSEEAASDVQKKLKTASLQHELILLLIENRSYSQVEGEWRKVLDLRLGARYEGAIAQSLLTIGYKLYEAKQFLIASKLMDASLSVVPFSNKDKADVLSFKALMLKEYGDVDGAIRTYRLASELADK